MARIALPRFTKFQAAVHIGALLPLILLVINWSLDNLTFNPVQALELRTGKYALILLILSLACTPINTIFGFSQVLKVRRPLGLYAFFYASIHFLIFIGLDYQFDFVLLQEAVFEKRYALVGFAAGVILLVLALTSTRGWMKRLGKTWSRIHRFVYLAGILVIIHYIWLVKSDIRVPLLYGGVVLFLLVARIPFVRKHLSRIRQLGFVRTLNQFPNSLRSKMVANSYLARSSEITRLVNQFLPKYPRSSLFADYFLWWKKLTRRRSRVQGGR